MKTLYIAYFGALKHLSHSQILPYLRELAGSGIEITLLSFEERQADGKKEREAVADLRQELRAVGIDWHWLRYHKRPSIPATAHDVALGTMYAAYLIIRKRIDVVHLRGHVPGLMGLMLKRLMNVKLLFDLRGLMAEEYVEAGRWSSKGVAFRLTKWVEEKLFERADAMVMLTESAVRVLKERSAKLSQSSSHIEVIPCCVDLKKFQVSARGFRIRLGLTDKTVMVYAGSTGGWYMSEELARLFRVAHVQQPAMHFLVLTQSPHQEMRDLLLAEGLPADSFTILTAAPSEMPSYLAAADFGVHFIRPGLSMIANSPTKFAEYLASGLPILTNAGIGDSDVVLRKENVGVVVKEFSVDAYKEALTDLHRLCADPTISKRCREVAERRYDLRSVGRAGYQRVYAALGYANKRQ